VDDCISPAVLEVARALIASGLTAQPASEPDDCEQPPYTVPEAADLLRVHESTLYRAIQDGDLGAYSVGAGGRAIRIPAAELEAFKMRRAIRPVRGSRSTQVLRRRRGEAVA
jgi:excisionase family DNA binding protein